MEEAAQVLEVETVIPMLLQPSHDGALGGFSGGNGQDSDDDDDEDGKEKKIGKDMNKLGWCGLIGLIRFDSMMLLGQELMTSVVIS